MLRSTLAAAIASAALVASSATASSAAPPAVLVVFVGGLGSDAASASANFAPLVGELVPRVAAREFVYGGNSAAYTAERSCQPIAQSTAELVAFVRELRDTSAAQSAILVGHSNGGVLALEAIAAAPDLAPWVRRVVAVDAPLGGLKWADAVLYGATLGACPAVDDLYARHATAGWSAYLAQLATWTRDQGTEVAIVANPRDLAVSLDEQRISGAAVNYTLEATGTDWNHAALLHAPDALAALAAIVAAP